MLGKDWDTIAAFLWGLSVGFIFGAFVWVVVSYAFQEVKDWLRKKKEGNFTLGRNMTKGRDPKLISLDDD